ncbi:MAG: polyprenyl synthetase family protein [Chloroflexi bacterium]|nr:polyprenyl synthetase family protein [Chloroflexota bacterium]
MTLISTIDDLSARVDAELSSIVNSRKMPLYRMMSYHMGWHDERGLSDIPLTIQRTHGVLCLLACRAAGGDLDVALPAASAVELVQNFCEIHDDVQGGNPQRDNRDAVWWVWGPAQAINTGDGMHALARLALFRLLDRGVSSVKTFQAVQLLDEASLQTCEGRFLDIEAQERIDMSLDAYLKMTESKSGALVSCAMMLGALAATDDERVLDALGASGAKLGVAMQMRADMRELWNPMGEDAAPSTEVMNKMKLLPVVYALENAKLSDKRRIGEIYFKRVLEPDDVVKLRGVIEEMGVRDACEKLVTQYHDEVVASLGIPGISEEGRADIERFADSLIG